MRRYGLVSATGQSPLCPHRYKHSAGSWLMIGMSTPEHRTRRLSCAHGQVGSQPCGGGERADDGAYGRRAVHGLIPPWVVGARDRRCTIGQTEPRKRTRLDQPSIGGALMMTERFPILTSREKKLLRRLAQGKADRAIAA